MDIYTPSPPPLHTLLHPPQLVQRFGTQKAFVSHMEAAQVISDNIGTVHVEWMRVYIL